MRASRRSDIAPFVVMQVLEAANRRAAAGEAVLHLEIGEPGGGAPRSAMLAAERALKKENFGYTEAFGLPSLRQRLVRHYRDWYGLDVDAERIALTVGASGAFVLAFLAAFDAGQRVAVAEPGYPAYRNILHALGIEVVALPAEISSRFQPTVAMLEDLSEPIDGLLLASPANPTGSMLHEDDLRALSAYCRQRGIRLIVDEIYHGITYERAAHSILEVDATAIVVNSFSKYFCMTGWRLGWLVLPADLVDATVRLAQNLFISPPSIAQYAALGAFDGHVELDANVDRYRQNRAVLIDALKQAGIGDIAPAEGAFYIYANIAHLGMDSSELCRRVLAATGVAITPGIDFDPVRGNDYVRLSFAGGRSEVSEAADRLSDWLRAPR